MLKLDLCDDQAGVVSREFVDLPDHATIINLVAALFDQWLQAQVIKQGARIGDRDGIFIFSTRGAFRNTLDCQMGPVFLDTNANRAFLVDTQVPLAVVPAFSFPPAVVCDQKFAFDFLTPNLARVAVVLYP